MLLSDDLLSQLPMEEYVQNAYQQTIDATPRLEGEASYLQRHREISYLNIRWFMAVLLDRMDRCSMYSGLEARVPFADHRILEYLWNVPPEMKSPNGVVKGLLRDAGHGLIPEEILMRKKSPYPKTYHPEYESLLSAQLQEVIQNPNAPIRPLIDPVKIHKFLVSPKNYGRPWYGQLMAGPQMLAYLLQINYWLEKYHIELVP